MTFQISAQVLSSALSSLGMCIDSKDPMPIRQNVFFHEADGQYIATASKEGQALHMVLPLDAVEDFHPFCIAYGELKQITSAVTDSIFPMTFTTGKHIGPGNQGNKLVIDYGEGTFTIQYVDPAQYPHTTVGKENFRATLPVAQFLPSIAAARLFVGNDTIRPIMASVHLNFTEGGLDIVATDSKCLYLRTLAGITASVGNTSVNVPKPALDALRSCIGKAEDELTIIATDKFVIFTTANFRLEASLTEGRFPRYAAVLPKSFAMHTTFAAKTFLSAVRRVSICANAATNQIRIDFTPGDATARMSTTDVDFSKSAHTATPLSDASAHINAPLAIGFRADRLIECISNMPSSEVQMNMNDASKAVVFEDAEHTTKMLLMPMVLTDF